MTSVLDVLPGVLVGLYWLLLMSWVAATGIKPHPWDKKVRSVSRIILAGIIVSLGARIYFG